MPQTAVTDTIKINTTVAGSQFAPAIAALSGGGYVIVWEDSSAGAIYAQRFNGSGQPVGSELHLDSTQGGSALWVSVAATANDGFVIAFQAGSFAQAEIFAHRYDSSNNPVGGLFAANTTSPNEQFNPHVTALDNGSLLFTWDTRVTLGVDTVNQEVRGRIYDFSGQAIGNDFAIAPVSATDQHGLSAISSLSGGGFVVTWQRAANSGSNFEIVGQRYTASGATVGAQFQANTQTAGNQYGNDVARLSDGGFVVSWVDPGATGIGGRVVARHYGADGVAIGGEITIDAKATGAYGRTVVTALANGGYVVAWPDGENDTNVAHNVTARAFGSNDVALDLAFDMSFDLPFGANLFSDGAITLANGNVVFAWDGPSVTPPGGQGTGEDVYMRVYSFSSAPPNTGGPGNDTLPGGPGPDTLIGLDGSDTYVVNDPGDAIVEAAGQGYDVAFTSVDYTLAAGQEVEGLVPLDFNGTAPLVLTGNEFANYIIGNAGANTLNGAGGNDTLEARGGNDILDGGTGADAMIGGLGDDTYYIDNAGDVVIEAAGQGNDVAFTSVSYALLAGQEVEGLRALDVNATTPLNLTGNEIANGLIGNAGANQLNGGAGADVMEGKGGNDTYIVDNAGDVVTETAGGGYDVIYTNVSYTLNDSSEVEGMSTLDWNSTAALNLTGNGLANHLIGNAGANVLNGGAGSDALYGRGGADVFVFSSALGATNVDTIGDMQSGTDKIHLDHNVFAGLSVGALGAGAFVTGTQAGDGDDRIIYNNATGQLFFDADGAGGNAAVLFATLAGAPALAASDFLVI